MQIRCNGKPYTVKRLEIEGKMRNVAPEPIRRFFVSIRGVRFPIKQVFSIATGLPAAAFQTGYAYNVLSRLGFEIIDAEQGGESKCC